MGAKLALVAMELASEKGAGHAETRLLVRMALSAFDDMDRPWTQLPSEDLCNAMGVADDDNGRQVVKRARRSLIERELLWEDGGGRNGQGPARSTFTFNGSGELLRRIKRGSVADPLGKVGGHSPKRRGSIGAKKGVTQRPAVKEEREEMEEGTPPTCKKHPSGWDHDEPCRTCMSARQAATTPRPTQSGITTVRPGSQHHCAPGTHRLVADGTCVRCDMRPELIAETERSYA